MRWVVGMSMMVMVGLAVACDFASTDGERRAGGECPEAACMSETPQGLIFYGHRLYSDPETERLGPVVENGEFALTFGIPEGAVGDWKVEVEPPEVLDAERTGTRSIRVTGRTPGDAMIRVVDARTGALYDRMRMQVDRLERVEVRNAKDNRGYLTAGCSEMVGIDVFTDSSRGFAMDAEMFVDGNPIPEAWDCYFIDVADNAQEVEFTVHLAGETFVSTMPVQAGACPSAQ